MSYDPEIHHRKSIRLRGYVYSAPGKYFVTICALEKACLFGGIADGQIALNDYGRMVEKVWKELPSHFPLVELDRFVVMPNHFHAIAVIVDPRAKRVGAGFPRPDSNPGETGVGAGFPRSDSNPSEMGVGAGFPRPDSSPSEMGEGAGFPHPMSPIPKRGGDPPPYMCWVMSSDGSSMNQQNESTNCVVWQAGVSGNAITMSTLFSVINRTGEFGNTSLIILRIG
jgi:hypothetical protein